MEFWDKVGEMILWKIFWFSWGEFIVCFRLLVEWLYWVDGGLGDVVEVIVWIVGSFWDMGYEGRLVGWVVV